MKKMIALLLIGALCVPVYADEKSDRIAEIEKEINDIISTEPYRYKHLLEDDALVAEKKAELQREIDEYTKYEKELQDILKTFLKNGATFQ